MRLGVMADVHGNEAALRAVLADAASYGVDRWWVLGDLVLLGPRPAEVLELLLGLPGAEMLRGNTDRYVLTGEQPHPHATVDDAVGSADLVYRYAAVAGGIGWARGALCQAGLMDVLAGLPGQLRTRLPDGTQVLGVHASPHTDDGTGIEPGIPDAALAEVLDGCGADIVVGGHTHFTTDRAIGGIRALNPGSAGLPRTPGQAGWLLIEDGPVITQRFAPFDAEAVARDLRDRYHPNAQFAGSILTGSREQVRTP
jgi:predicted phosphodiesterase